MSKNEVKENVEVVAKDVKAEKTVETVENKMLEEVYKNFENENASQVEMTAESEDVDTAVVTNADYPEFKLVRRAYDSKGQKYWEYLIPVIFAGRVSYVRFKAADVRGYDSLDSLFNLGSDVKIRVEQMSQFDERLNTTRTYLSYKAVAVDSDGTEWFFPVRPSQASDRAVLENYLNSLLKKKEKDNK